MKVGLNLLIITVHPMKYGATLMSSFLFNTGLVLLATNAAIQFCAQAFALYANETAIQQIWGGQVSSWPSCSGGYSADAPCTQSELSVLQRMSSKLLSESKAEGLLSVHAWVAPASPDCQ